MPAPLDAYGNPIGSRRLQTVLYNLTSGAQVASFTSGDIDVTDVQRAALNVNVTAVSGATPSLTVTVERKAESGVYLALFTSTAITAAGSVVASIGPGLATAHALGRTLRVSFAITGGTPSFTLSADLSGR